MNKVIGNIASVPNPKSDWGQNDERKADYIKNKPDLTVFANALKGTASGEAIGITDISPIEHNMAVSVSTKNIIKFPYYTPSGTVFNGITYTVNDDGSVTVNGTTTSGTSMYYITEWTNNAWLNDWFEDGKTYVIGGNITTPKVEVILQCKRLSNNKDVYYYGNGKPFTIDKNTYKYCFLRIQVEPNTTVDNVTIYPIINKGTVVLPYAPYIEDISTVKLYKGGKSLISPYTLYGGLKGYKEGIDEATGRKYIRFVDDKLKQFNWNFKENTQYTVSAWVKTTILESANNQNSHILYFWYTDGTTSIASVARDKDWSFVSKTSSAGKTIQSIGMYTYNYVNYVYVDVDTFMLEESPTPTGYEPYIELTMYDVSTDGTVEGVKSLYPSTTLYTDTSGAVIDCTYNRDINKAFAELQAMILEG